MSGKFELYKDKADEHRFRLKAGNGEIIGTSQGYKAKSSATNGIESVKKNALLDERYEIYEGKSNKWYFNLKSANHQVILSSQGYTSKNGAENGTDAVKRTAPGAEIIEV